MFKLLQVVKSSGFEGESRIRSDIILQADASSLKKYSPHAGQHDQSLMQLSMIQMHIMYLLQELYLKTINIISQ